MRLFSLAAMALIVASSSASAESPRGWRTDGTGVYPAENPPTKWSVSTNVIWATELPPSNSIPLIVGDRVFSGAEPFDLVCLDKSSGKILWQKSNGYKEIVPPAQWAKIEEELSRETALDKERRAIQKEIGQVKKRLKKNEIDQKTAEGQLQKLEADVDKVVKKIEALELAAKWKLPRAHGHAGYSTPTPTTDGKHVWITFGNGIAACYDLNGQRQWIKLVETPRGGFGHTSSPVLIDDKLIVQFGQTYGLDPKTGKEIWQSRGGSRFGTAIPLEINGEPCVLTASCELIRASDGEKIAKGRGRLSYASPVVQGDKAYFVQNMSRALKIPSKIEKNAQMESVWFSRLPGRRYFTSPIIHKGLVYTINNEKTLSVLSEKDGKLVYERQLDLGKGNVYPGMSLIGRYLYIGSSNGTTLVVESGSNYREVAKNHLEPWRSAPVYHQGRLYLRTLSHLYCIGNKAEE